MYSAVLVKRKQEFEGNSLICTETQHVEIAALCGNWPIGHAEEDDWFLVNQVGQITTDTTTLGK